MVGRELQALKRIMPQKKMENRKNITILNRSAFQGANFTSPKRIREAIAKFIEVYNPQAAPFQWTKQYVYLMAWKINYPDLCN